MVDGRVRRVGGASRATRATARGRDEALSAACTAAGLPAGVAVRAWGAADFPAVQRLSAAEGWPTTTARPEEARASWHHSWPALVATPAGESQEVIGFLRALTDGAIATYICEFIVAARWRGKGVGRALLEVCHQLHPRARIDLLSTPGGRDFYVRLGFVSHAGFRRSHV